MQLVTCQLLFHFSPHVFLFFQPQPLLSFHLNIHRHDLVSRSFIAGSTRGKFSLKQDRFCLLTFSPSSRAKPAIWKAAVRFIQPQSGWKRSKACGPISRPQSLQSVWTRPHEINVGSHPVFSPIPKYVDISTSRGRNMPHATDFFKDFKTWSQHPTWRDKTTMLI